MHTLLFYYTSYANLYTHICIIQIFITRNQPATLTSTFDTLDASHMEDTQSYMHCHSDLFTA